MNLRVSPELAEALRNEIRAALDAGGRPFDAEVARRVYDLAIAASDMCMAAMDIDNLGPDGGRVLRCLPKHDQERTPVTPQLAEALRAEIRAALDADGAPFDVNVARRVYDLAIAARDMCIAATSTVEEAIDQIKDTNGPIESLDTPGTPESQVQVSESFGARLLRELMATLPLLQGQRGEDPKQLVHALAEARRNGMHDVAEQIEVKLFGRPLSGPRPITAEEVDVAEGSYEHGYADGRAGALPESAEGPYHEGYLKGTTAKYLDAASAAIGRDIRLGRTSGQIRDEIIAEVGMMADARTPEMQARYDAAVARERLGLEVDLCTDTFVEGCSLPRSHDGNCIRRTYPVAERPTSMRDCACPTFDNTLYGMHHDQACPRFAHVALDEEDLARLHPDTRTRYAKNAASMPGTMP